jgi:2-succinyl-6-hydroxy-2,4-cyclohexadiene-1-carboxylate synthase
MRYLLLHGFTGTPESFGALRVPAGSVTPSLGGHLGTEVVGDYWDEVERLAALGERADCRGLLGYSLGGRLALGLLARHPERYAHALILSAHPGLTTSEERTARRESDSRFVRLLHERGIADFVSAWEDQPLWATQEALAETKKLAQRAQRLRHDPRGLAQSLLQHGLAEMPDLRPLLGAVRGKIEILAGEQDAKFVVMGRELSGIIPGAELRVVAGAGHNLLIERAELCSARFLEGTSA